MTKPTPGWTGPPEKTRTLPVTPLVSVSPSRSRSVAIGRSPIGRLTTMPNAPFWSCATIKMTVRSKRGSLIEGAATRNWPAIEPVADGWAAVGRGASSQNADASIAVNAAVSVNIGRLFLAEDTTLPPDPAHGSLRVRPKTSSWITELSQHEADGGEFQEREGTAVEIFPVLGEAAATIEPRNRAFNDPTLGQLHKPLGLR